MIIHYRKSRGLMEDITRNPDNPDDTDKWTWSFDDDDTSRDATKKARQDLFLHLPNSAIPR